MTLEYSSQLFDQRSSPLTVSQQTPVKSFQNHLGDTVSIQILLGVRDLASLLLHLKCLGRAWHIVDVESVLAEQMGGWMSTLSRVIITLYCSCLRSLHQS